MELRFVILLISLCALVLGSSGCLAVAVGAGAAGTVAYLSGDLETAEPYDIDAVFAASKKALGQLELSVLEGRMTKDALAATIVARDAADTQVVVKLKSTVSGTTTISVRVGTFGNETKSRLIYDQIRRNLKEA